MIIFYIKPTNNKVASDAEYETLAQALILELSKKKFLSPYQTGYQIALTLDGLALQYDGITSEHPHLNIEGASNYLVRELGNILIDMGLHDIYMVKSLLFESCLNDRIIIKDSFKPTDTRNSILIGDSVPDDAIPAEFLCSMSQQIMDDPIYTIVRPDIKYNAAHLRFWLQNQDRMSDPLTRVPLSLTDIKEDTALKQRISSFVTNVVKKRLEGKVSPLLEIMEKYKLEVNMPNFAKAFRRAAAENNIINMKILLEKVNNIDAQDNNPNNRRTALHWAVIKNSSEAVRFLLDRHAKSDIKDASGKTAIDYTNSLENRDIYNMFMDLAMQTCSSNAFRIA